MSNRTNTSRNSATDGTGLASPAACLPSEESLAALLEDVQAQALASLKEGAPKRRGATAENAVDASFSVVRVRVAVVDRESSRHN